MNHPDSQGRYNLLCELFRACYRRPAPPVDATGKDREEWSDWLKSPAALKAALDRAINAENQVALLKSDAEAWRSLVKAAEHSSISSVELSGDMEAPNKWIATGNTLDGDFFEALQAPTAEQAVENLAEALRERDAAGMEDG